MFDIPPQTVAAQQVEPLPDSNPPCVVCGDEVLVAIQRGSGICSDICAKVHRGEIAAEDLEEYRDRCRKR